MIRRARRDGREARGSEEREKREDREREQRGDRERDKKTEEKEGLRDHPLLEFLDLTLRCSHCFFKSSDLWCYQLYNDGGGRSYQ